MYFRCKKGSNEDFQVQGSSWSVKETRLGIKEF